MYKVLLCVIFIVIVLCIFI